MIDWFFLLLCSGVPRSEAQRHFLSVCSSLQMYGVSLFAAYVSLLITDQYKNFSRSITDPCWHHDFVQGENHTEYFLGPTPVGVVIFKNKELVGKYLW